MNVLDIFYNEILDEAKNGRIDCGFIYNVIFNTISPEKSFYVENSDNDLQIPTLYISNKQVFDELLIKYVEKCINLYDQSYYDNNHDYIKAIITFLITNMSVEEFMDPIRYLNKRINFLDNIPDDINNYSKFGDSSYLGEIEYMISSEPLYEETPYSLKFKIGDSILPTVRFGIDNNKVYIYAIQNEHSSYLNKKINRTLYKINENFDTTDESFDNINDFENLTGISPSSVCAATLATAYFRNKGYSDILISSFLPVRYNAKVLSTKKKLEKEAKKNNYDDEQIEILTLEKEEENLNIQRNISDKLVRTFRRIDNQFDSIDIISYPYDVDSFLHLTVNDKVYCSNPFLEDLYNSFRETKRK